MVLPTQDAHPSNEECARSLNSVLDALYVLNGKWKLPLILSLLQSPKRFNEIQSELTGLSPKVLANELKHLEENEFVRRHVFPTTPVTIRYEATDYSRTLRTVLQALGTWGAQHRERIKQRLRESSQ